MTDELKYDPDFPYVVKIGQVAKGRFKDEADARDFSIEFTIAGTIIDTTPKPKIPEDAEFVHWRQGATDYYARSIGGGQWIDDSGDQYSTYALTELVEDVELTVLVRLGEAHGGASRQQEDS